MTDPYAAEEYDGPDLELCEVCRAPIGPDGLCGCGEDHEPEEQL